MLLIGEVAERLKAQHWKCCLGVTLTRVRIPPSPFFNGVHHNPIQESPFVGDPCVG